jgi:hypothetical protein
MSMGALYKERRLINSGGKVTNYEQEILKLLDTIWAPKLVAVIHCQEHQKGNTTIAAGKPES